MPTLRFIALLYGIPTHIPELKAKAGSSVPPNSIHYIAFSHHTCFFLTRLAAYPAELFPENLRPQNSPPPYKGAGKMKEHWRKTLVLAANSSRSFNRSH
jgi:hypothetical protein